MKLPVAILFDQLSAIFSVKKSRIPKHLDSSLYALPKIYNGCGSLQADILYVADVSQFRSCPLADAHCAVIAIGEPDRGFGHDPFPMIILDKSYDLTEVYAAVIDIYRKFENFDPALFTGQNTVQAKHTLNGGHSLQTNCDTFRTLISNSFNPVGQLIRNTEMKPESRYRCVVLRMISRSGPDVSAAFLCHQLQSILDYAICILQGNDIVILVDIDSPVVFSQWVENLETFVESYALTIGVSNEFTELVSCKPHYHQACMAIEYGLCIHCGKTVYYFRDYALSYILEFGTTAMSAEMIAADGIVRLAEIDESRGTDFCLTLRTFFLNKMNAVQTAKQLNIHRSTFKYRMERIKSILDVDLDDYFTCLYLQLSLAYHNNRERKPVLAIQ